jgi:ribose 5-phosphate isomerase B
MPGSVGLRSQRSAEEVDNRRYMVAVGTDDDAGVNLKDFIQESLQEDRRAEEVRDFNVADVVRQDGVPGHLHKGRRGARQGRGGQGRALRWRGLGEAISANEVRGCAAVATDPYSIERSVLSNNCQVLCLGERVVAPMLAERVVQRWPGYGLDESSLSARKADLISECE